MTAHSRHSRQRGLRHGRRSTPCCCSRRSIVGLLRWRNPGERYAELAARTESWWWMIGAFTLCVLFNQTVAIVFLAFISYLALKEYLSLIPTRRIDRERAAVRLSRHSPPILLGGDRLVRHVHRVRAGVDVPVLPGADGAQRRDARLPARGRHAVLGPDDDGVHAEPHGDAAGLGRRVPNPVAGGIGLAVLSRGARPSSTTWRNIAGASFSAATRSRRR